MGQTSGQPSVITHLVNQLRDAQAQQRIEDARGLARIELELQCSETCMPRL